MKKKKPSKAVVGRPRIGEAISITLTDEQRAWVDAQIPPGGTRTSVVRRLVDAAMRGIVFTP